MGTLVSGLGVYFSVLFDTPTGATIVCTFGAVLIAMFFVHLFLSRERKAELATSAKSAHEQVPQ
jgi:ABC-type Mn2+/Zn2+ transport system permease subunit